MWVRVCLQGPVARASSPVLVTVLLWEKKAMLKGQLHGNSAIRAGIWCRPRQPRPCLFAVYVSNTANGNPISVFTEKELCGLSPNFHIHESVSDLYTVFPRSVHLFSCSRIGRPFMKIHVFISLTDTWMWKLGLRPRNSFTGNICIVSLQCGSQFCNKRLHNAYLDLYRSIVRIGDLWIFFWEGTDDSILLSHSAFTQTEKYLMFVIPKVHLYPPCRLLPTQAETLPVSIPSLLPCPFFFCLYRPCAIIPETIWDVPRRLI